MTKFNSEGRMKLFRPKGLGLFISLLVLCLGYDVSSSHNLKDGEKKVLNLQQYLELSENYAPQSDNREPKVSLQVDDMLLIDALHELASELGVDISINAQKIRNKKVSYRANNLYVYDVLDDLLGSTDLEVFLSEDNRILIIREQEGNRDLDLFQETVTGRVADAVTGEALPGVNIVIEGTSTGTTTDLNGDFSLRVPGLHLTLVVSYIGYQPQNVPIEGRSEIEVQLEPSVEGLGDVVVTAFGIARDRAAVAYSVSEVQGEALTRSREINVADNLTGRIAGVNATQMGGGVGGSSSRILIRGTGSLSGDNQPLYVINGMPMSNNRRMQGAFESGASVTDKGDGIQHINPDDIESISVLKGGAAAALYGSQAANGVVLITTKQGTVGREGVGVEFNSNFTVGTINRFPDLQTEYGQGFEGRRPQTQQEALSTGRLGFGERIDDQPTINFDGVMRPYSLHTPKQQMQEFYRPSIKSTNTISFDGGTQSVVYRLSLSNLDVKNIQPNSEYNRKSANLNIRAFVTEKLSITGVMQYTYDEGINRPIINYAPGNANWGVTLLANTVPIQALAPGYDEETLRETEWQHVAIATNPYFAVNRMSNSDSKNRMMSQGSVTYNILSNLYVKGDIMQDFEVWESEYYIPMGTAARPDGQYRSNDELNTRLNVQTIVGYETAFQDFNFSAMAGGNMERVDNTYTNLTGLDFIIPEFHSFANLGTTSTSRDVITQGTNSLFASADVNFRQSYYLSVTGRQDWFSTLNIDNNGIFYPSVGGSVVLSNVLDLPEVINFARVRASWAQIGAATVSPFAINRTFALQEGGHLGVPVQTTSTSEVNPDLRPLTSTTREVGFDIDFFDSRFGIDLTLYERKNEDDIVTTNLPLSSGATSTILNVGEINNQGVELLLTAEPIRRNAFRWRTSYNLGYNHNRVEALAPGTPVGGTSLLGHPVSMFFARGMAVTADGTPIYNSRSNYEADGPFDPMGPGVPPWTMGISNTFLYRSLALDILVDAKFGNKFFSRHHQYFHRFGHAKETLPGREDGLTVRGVDENGNDFEHFWPASFMATYYNNQGRYTQLFVQNGSFIKLRSVSLSYSLPTHIVDFMNVSGVEVSLVGRNLAILFSETDHFDPEQSYDASDNSQNFSGTQLPRTREIGLNLNVKF